MHLVIHFTRKGKPPYFKRSLAAVDHFPPQRETVKANFWFSRALLEWGCVADLFQVAELLLRNYSYQQGHESDTDYNPHTRLLREELIQGTFWVKITSPGLWLRWNQNSGLHTAIPDLFPCLLPCYLHSRLHGKKGSAPPDWMKLYVSLCKEHNPRTANQKAKDQ